MENNVFDKLNNAGLAIVEADIEEYKSEIQDQLSKTAILNDKSVEELSAKEVYESIADLKRKKEKSVNILNMKKNRMLIVLGMTGVMYSFVGLILYFMKTSNTGSILSGDISVIIAVFGSVVSFMSIFLLYFYSIRAKSNEAKNSLHKRQQSSSIKWDITKLWVEIEKLVNEELNKNSANNKYISPISAMNWIKSTDRLSKENHELIQKILKIRNETVHGSNKIDYSNDELEKIKDEAIALLAKLSLLIK